MAELETLEHLADYRLLRKLGEGAAGTVYLATPSTDLTFAKAGRPLAVKVYKPSILGTPGQRARQDREFRTGSLLDHPHLVRIHSHDLDGDTPHLVMEYVDGQTLSEWLTMYGSMPLPLLRQVLTGLVDGVRELHVNGVTHRDIKPANIMLDSAFAPKIMDFGVVKIDGETSVTPKGWFLGTLRNSSPELVYGGTYDHRTDLYSLGTVTYALLHGQEVFSEISQRAQLTAAVKESVPAFDYAVTGRDPTTTALAELAADLLKKDADNRPQSIDEVAERLEAVWDQGGGDALDVPLHGYVATALTNVASDADAQEATTFVSSRIAEIAKGHGIYVYQPRKLSDPLRHKGLDATSVYDMDRARVVRADILFVLANKPSFGVGMELEIASTYGIHVVLVARTEVEISRMVTGSYLNMLRDPIYYDSPEELDRHLSRCLNGAREQLLFARTARSWADRPPLGAAVAKVREEVKGWSLEDLSRETGLPIRLLAAIERGDVSNIALDLIWRISQALGLELNGLVGSPISVSELGSPTFRPDANLRRLEALAKKARWGATDYCELRDDYLRQAAAKGESSTLSDDMWLNRQAALQRRRVGDEESPEDDDPQRTLL